MISSAALFHNRQASVKSILPFAMMLVLCLFVLCSCSNSPQLEPTGFDYTKHTFTEKTGNEILDFQKPGEISKSERIVNGRQTDFTEDNLKEVLSYLQSATLKSIDLANKTIDNLPESVITLYNAENDAFDLRLYKRNDEECILISPSLDRFFNPNQAYVVKTHPLFFDE